MGGGVTSCYDDIWEEAGEATVGATCVECQMETICQLIGSPFGESQARQFRCKVCYTNLAEAFERLKYASDRDLSDEQYGRMWAENNYCEVGFNHPKYPGVWVFTKLRIGAGVFSVIEKWQFTSEVEAYAVIGRAVRHIDAWYGERTARHQQPGG